MSVQGGAGEGTMDPARLIAQVMAEAARDAQQELQRFARGLQQAQQLRRGLAALLGQL